MQAMGRCTPPQIMKMKKNFITFEIAVNPFSSVLSEDQAINLPVHTGLDGKRFKNHAHVIATVTVV